MNVKSIEQNIVRVRLKEKSRVPRLSDFFLSLTTQLVCLPVFSKIANYAPVLNGIRGYLVFVLSVFDSVAKKKQL